MKQCREERQQGFPGLLRAQCEGDGCDTLDASEFDGWLFDLLCEEMQRVQCYIIDRFHSNYEGVMSNLLFFKNRKPIL
jgi:hypothetical protein